MSENSPIEWTDSTWNPTRGCSRVSQGCQRCYAERTASRFGGVGGPYAGLLHANGSWNGKIILAEDHLRDPISWGKPRRIFVDSMSDLFHEAIPFEYIDKVFAVMACTTRHTYQILTKRPQRMLEYFGRLRWGVDVGDDFEGLTFQEEARLDPNGLAGLPDQIRPSRVYDEWKPNRGRGGYDNCGPGWPLTNVWLGVSCENQETADERIPLLIRVPAAIRFLSCEPLLGPIDLSSHLGIWWNSTMRCWESTGHAINRDMWGGHRLDWVIVGGESGPNARSMTLGWAKEIVEACRGAAIAPFVKQLGTRPVNREGELHSIGDRKGGNMTEWPEALRVREWPMSAGATA